MLRAWTRPRTRRPARIASLRSCPNYVQFLQEEGTTFTNSFVSESLCCPSRATFLTGQYAHNHGVLNNSGADGGCTAFHDNGDEGHTIVTWLHELVAAVLHRARRQVPERIRRRKRRRLMPRSLQPGGLGRVARRRCR